jgi:photosystem II stability/assembly factor-like uncharacterized protein
MTRLLLAVVMLAGAATAPLAAQVQTVSGVRGEFRALSAAGSAIWASGRDGTYARSTDGGDTWIAGVIPGAQGLFLVDVEAFAADSACVLATSFDGGLGRIYRTSDGGRSWITTYEVRHPQVFFDGLAFWSRERGLAFSDPIDGAFLIVLTADGCATWSAVPPDRAPAALPGESGFAASGTAVAVGSDGRAWIGTGGGVVARVLRTRDAGLTWTATETPMPGGAGTGIFGVAFRDSLHGLAVGGNYQQPASDTPNVLRTVDGGETWVLAGTTAPVGVRYGVAYVPGDTRTVLAVGPTGVGMSRDDGATWATLDTLNTFTLLLQPRRAWLAGPSGRIVRLAPAPWLTGRP